MRKQVTFASSREESRISQNRICFPELDKRVNEFLAQNAVPDAEVVREITTSTFTFAGSMHFMLVIVVEYEPKE